MAGHHTVPAAFREVPPVESEIERLRKKVENFPSASLYTRLAELLRQGGDNVGAEAVCRRCIKDFPRSGQAYVILAELQIQAGQKGEARQLLELAVEKEPRSYPAQRLLADLSEDKDEALRHLHAILAFKPGDPAAVQRIQELGGNVPAPGTRAFRAPAPPPSSTTGSSRLARAAMTTPQPGNPATGAHSPGTRSVSSRFTVAGSVPLPKTTTPLPPGDSHIVPFPEITTGPADPRTATRAPALPPSAVSGNLRRSRTASLEVLCGEAGVRGAVLADSQGRVLSATRIEPGRDELLAALALEVGRSAAAAQAAAGNPAPTAWSLQGSQGQVLAFTRNQGVTILVVANAGVRPAMVELRARQVLVDLGGAN